MSEPTPQHDTPDAVPELDGVPDAAALSYFNYRLSTGTADADDRRWMVKWVFEAACERHKRQLEDWSRRHDDAERRRDFHKVNSIVSASVTAVSFVLSSTLAWPTLFGAACLMFVHKVWLARNEAKELNEQIGQREEDLISQGFKLAWTKRRSWREPMRVSITPPEVEAKPRGSQKGVTPEAPTHAGVNPSS